MVTTQVERGLLLALSTAGSRMEMDQVLQLYSLTMDEPHIVSLSIKTRGVFGTFTLTCWDSECLQKSLLLVYRNSTDSVYSFCIL